MDRQIEFADLLSIVSLYLAIRNLSENEAQSDAQIKILRHKGYSSAYGYKWKYHGDTSDFNHSTRGKPIVQCSLDGEYIAKFWNAKETSEKTGICHTSIRRCAKGIHKTAGGFVWKEIPDEKD